MTMQTEPRGGLNFGWTYGEHGWNSGMDANFLRLGRFGFHLSINGSQCPTVLNNSTYDAIRPGFFAYGSTVYVNELRVYQ